MSSSDDEKPLGRKVVMANAVHDSASEQKDLTSTDTTPQHVNEHVKPGISIRNGPVENGDLPLSDINGLDTNGATAKRKSRGSLIRPSYAEAASSDEDEEPLSKRRRTSNQQPAGRGASGSDKQTPKSTSNEKRTPLTKGPQARKASRSDAPAEKKLVNTKEKIQGQAAREAVGIRKDAQVTNQAAGKRKPRNDAVGQDRGPRKASASKKMNGIKKETSDDDDDDVPLSKKVAASKPSKRIKTEASSPTKAATKGKRIKKEESVEVDEDVEADEEEYRWWEAPTSGDGTKKWTTLQHQGVIFPPPYEPLPQTVKMLYDGKPVSMHPDAEEVATFFGSMLNSTHNVENPTFQKNFFRDFQEILRKTGGAKDRSGEKVAIKQFDKCDFTAIYDYYAAQREAKKALPSAEKKKIRAEKEEVERPYMYCMWDGRKQKVGNFRVEPPGLFRGRGEHPKTGTVKTRVLPEQITINIGKEATVPPPPAGHKWKEIRHDQEGTWLAMWQENVNNNYKYVMLAANSDVKGQSDYKKFEKARELKEHIDRIRADYRDQLKSQLTQERQKATAVYLIDQFALRAGNEKNEEEADTVGCCSLKFEHVTLQEPNTVIFDFLGKDSIPFYDEVKVDPQVFKNLKLFKRAPKGEGDEIFDRLTTSALNKHLSNYMSGLTAKVFRTYNASYTMSKLLEDMRSTGTTVEKIKDYNNANRKVAILCNHKRTVAAGHATQMEKYTEEIKGIRYQQWRLKQMMLDLEPKLKKKKGAEYFALPEDMDEAWIQEHQAQVVAKKKADVVKKFDRDNEKAKAAGEKEMSKKELEEKLEVARDLERLYKKENKSKKIEAEGKGITLEKLESKVARMDEQIANKSHQAEDKENNKEVALGTSKINYIDPRLTVVFSKRFDVPIEKFFSKTLREKFDWAIKSVDEDWQF